MSSDDAPTAPAPSKGPVLLVLLNTIALLAAAGTFAYTRILFKRPPITEEAERTRLALIKSQPQAPTTPGTILFEPFTVNIKPTMTDRNGEATTHPPQGRMHYAKVGFTVDIRDNNRRSEVEALRPILMDQIVGALGHKEYHELTSVQGRYLLRTQIIDLFNAELTKKSKDPNVVVTNVFFTDFLVQ